MSTELKYILLTISIAFFIFILIIIKKKHFSLRYSMVWLFSSLLLIFCASFPSLVIKISHFLGFEEASNMVFVITIGICILILISLTIIVSKQNKQIVLLTQELSILNKEKEEK